MNDWCYPSDREQRAEGEAAFYKWYAPQLEARVRVLQARIDELEAQSFIKQANEALPLFEVMHLEPCAFPSIRP